MYAQAREFYRAYVTIIFVPIFFRRGEYSRLYEIEQAPDFYDR